VIDEPEEEIAHGALPGLDAVVAGQHAAIDDAAHAGDVRERLAGGCDHEVAGAGAEDFHQGAFFDARADRAGVGIEGPDGDRGAFLQAERFGPLGAEFPGLRVGGVGFARRGVTQVGELRVELGEEFFVRQAAPFALNMALCPAAQTLRFRVSGSVLPVSTAGIQSQCSTKLKGGLEDRFGSTRQAGQDFAPKPFAGVNAAAFGDDCGRISRGRAR
jgi:hypothetical protein